MHAITVAGSKPPTKICTFAGFVLERFGAHAAAPKRARPPKQAL
jgi:hypothetical protein